jgi:hypothetical protein
LRGDGGRRSRFRGKDTHRKYKDTVKQVGPIEEAEFADAIHFRNHSNDNNPELCAEEEKYFHSIHYYEYKLQYSTTPLRRVLFGTTEQRVEVGRIMDLPLPWLDKPFATLGLPHHLPTPAPPAGGNIARPRRSRQPVPGVPRYQLQFRSGAYTENAMGCFLTRAPMSWF